MNCNFCPLYEEEKELLTFLLIKRSETWKGLPNGTIKRGWNTPDTPIPVSPFFELIEMVLFHSVGWIGDNTVNAVFGNDAHPFKAIGVNDDALAASFVRIAGSEFAKV